MYSAETSHFYKTEVIKVFVLHCTSLRLSLFQVYGTPVFEEDDASSAAAAATNGDTRSRGGGGGQNFKKKVSKTSLLHSLDNEDDQTFGSPAFYSNETTGDGASGSSGQNGARERPILSIFKMLNGNRSGLSVKDVFHAQRDYPALDLGSEGGGGRLMPPPPISQAKDDAEDDEDDEEESDEQDEEDEDDNLLLPDPRFRFRPPEDRGKQQQQQPGNTWNNMAATSGPVILVTTTATTTTTRTTTTRATTTTTTTARATATTERSTTTPAWKTPIMPLSTPYGQQQLPYDRYSWDRDHHRGGSLTDIHSPSYVDTVYDTLDTPSDSRHGYHGEVDDLGQQREVNDVHDDARHYPRDHFFPMSIEPSQQRKEVLLRWVPIV